VTALERSKVGDIQSSDLSPPEAAPDGQRYQLNLGQGASNTKNPPLRDGDTVVVNRSNYAMFTDALDAVTTPLSGLVNSWGLVQLVRDNNNN
jgi:polysaccharide export outer membrane protein